MTTDSKNIVNAIRRYQDEIIGTDQFKGKNINPIFFGLYGEVGDILTVHKKSKREDIAHKIRKKYMIEEFGDTLWYFSTICQHTGHDLEHIFSLAIQSSNQIARNKSDKLLVDLGYSAATILKLDRKSEEFKDSLVNFAGNFIKATEANHLSIDEITKINLVKVISKFSKPKIDSSLDFDINFPIDEQLPRNFEIKIEERKSGQCYMSLNGVFIGSPLTDNTSENDGYRYHDVFHLANAAILHWSPTFRALIKHKRKSCKDIEEAQDSGRAIVIEEGLSAWLFSYSKSYNYFKGYKQISFDALKVIEKFVHGYEVEKCPLSLWEKAILDGYSVFRKVKNNNGGIVIGDRSERTIKYKKLRTK